MKPFRLLVTGSRHWDADDTIGNALTTQLALCTALGQPLRLVHGGCATGADKIADQWARWHRDGGVTIERWPAAWRRHGRAAGPLRNKAMVDAGADIVFAFIRSSSPGATGCAALAEQAGIPVRRWTA